MSSQTGSRRYTHTHLKWFIVTLVHYFGETFHFFIFCFLVFPHKKHKKANQRISYFFSTFLSSFFIFVCSFAFCAFVWLRFSAFVAFYAFGAFLCFLCFFVRAKSFRKNKNFKTALITLFILLLLLIFFLSCFYFI